MTVFRLALQILVACSFVSSSVFAVEDGAIVEQTAYRFPAYEQAVQTTDVERETDKAIYETAVNDSRFEFLKLKNELIVYATDNHSLTKNREDRDCRAITWFKRHLKN